jgi:predicted AlkP superfamily phosphohydrolase/phosphomutase
MILIIGLDGADWRILDPWIEDGSLPTLAALKARGRWGDLASTIRPESSIAWTTFATGVNAGKHGVFGFVAQQPHSYQVTLNTAASVRVPAFWQRAAAADKKVALLNVPMTYPPRAIPHGAVVAGMLTPSVRSPFTQPPELRQRLLDAVPDYVINVERTGMKLREFIRATTRAIRARGRAARWLLQQDDWDAMVAVFTATDRLQHYTLHLLHPDHPRHDPDEARRLLPDLLDAYQAIDAAIADLLDAAGPDATVILLSDHGFTPVVRAFYINAWLRDNGWLALKEPPRTGQPGLWRRLRRHAGLRRLKNSLPLVRDVRRPPTPAPWLDSIDWTRTRAFYSPGGGIRFNLRGREPQGIVEEAEIGDLSAELTRALLDATGEAGQCLDAVYPREALYQGPELARAPDLIVEPRRDDGADQNAIIRKDFPAHHIDDSGELTGNHAYAGILLAVGPGIAPLAPDETPVIASARLLDMAPTILHLLGLPIPAEMDGRALDFVTGDITRAGASDDAPSPEASADLSAEDQDIIQERLRSLGYL